MKFLSDICISSTIQKMDVKQLDSRSGSSMAADSTSDSISGSGSADSQSSSLVAVGSAAASGDSQQGNVISSGDGVRKPVTSASSAVKRSPNDFIFEKVLGEGSFSTVYLARDIHTQNLYAVKVCEKRHIIREKKEAYVKREKAVMQLLCAHPHPFFVQLFCTFHDVERLYFVMTYARNGEILPYLHKVGCFDADCTRFYSAEVILALEHLHRLGVIHRDIKPENILLNEKMHILITDFGSAKIIGAEDSKGAAAGGEKNNDEEWGRPRRNSFVGTADYVSPELLTNKETCKSSDLWALGCLVYQFLAGLPPFRAGSEYLIFQRVMKVEYAFPDGFNSVAKDLVAKLLVKEPSKRLGSEECGGYPELRAHPFYDGVDWEHLHERTPPVICPHLPIGDEELRSDIIISPNVQPGFDEKQLSRLLDLQLRDTSPSGKAAETGSIAGDAGGMLDIPPEEYAERLAEQAKNSPWHKFVDNHLILKQGIIDKRKGLFARRRMFLLTTGPHFYYVDPVNMVLKGEIPWSADMKPEPKNFKTFFVHTPNRTYYLEDPAGYALEWCKVLEQVRAETFDKKHN